MIYDFSNIFYYCFYDKNKKKTRAVVFGETIEVYKKEESTMNII